MELIPNAREYTVCDTEADMNKTILKKNKLARACFWSSVALNLLAS